jgi:hypothetical protein
MAEKKSVFEQTVVTGTPLANSLSALLPMVAIHVSETTQALETLVATPPTPTGADTSGFQWWYTSWHYFVMYESLKEALNSDGTPYVEVSDADIGAGGLLTAQRSPLYPIVLSLASEAIGDSVIAPLRDYVAAGGFLFLGSSAFTRRPDGTTRGDFALANEMGLHMVNAGLTNWYQNQSFNKLIDHRLVSHIPWGMLTWRMPLTSEQTPWKVPPPTYEFHAAHYVWQVKVNNAADAEVIANGGNGPLLATKVSGEGRFIYHGAMQPLIGHGGFDNGMYSYAIYRSAIEWAFEAANVPIVKLSPWRYPYDAAFVVRHDFENTPSRILAIESSAQFEQSVGAKGDYYFCTGVIRAGSEDTQLSPQEKLDAIASVQRAVSQHGATIGSHNGGLPNPANPFPPNDYQYWHWGSDEALDTTPPGYADGKAYAQASIQLSFQDLKGWLAGLDNGRAGCGASGNCPRLWASPFFNSTRENSYDIFQSLDVSTVGEQKCSPFPHWTVSTQILGKRHSHLTLPVGDWYVGSDIAQAIDLYPDNQSLHDAIDFYYSLGALINIYTHESSASGLPQEYVNYNLSKPRRWATNAIGVYDWWTHRSNVKVTPTYSMSGAVAVAEATVAGATDPETSVELVIPNWATGAVSTVQIFLNGAPADPASYRLTTYGVKVKVGATVSNLQVRYTLLQTWTQTNWVGGPGQTTWSDAKRFDSSTGIDFSIAEQIRLNLSAGGNVLFSDDFTRTPPQPMPFTWTIPPLALGNYGQFSKDSGVLNTSTSALAKYGFAYPTNVTMTDHSVEADVRFQSGDFGGGISGRLNASNGQRYSAWIYPDGSTGGSNVLKLIKYTGWTTWTGTPIQQVSLPSVGTGWHHLKMRFTGKRIRVYYDNSIAPIIDKTDSTLASGYAGVDFWTHGNTSGSTYNNFVVRNSTNNVVFSDDFGPDPLDPLLPWSRQLGNWAVTNGVLQGSSAVSQYAYVYHNDSSWTDYTVEGRVQFPAGAFGGGIGGRVNPTSGAHYGAWVYPDGSGGGSNVLKLIKFRDWTSWSGSPMQQVNLPSVGTNWHTLKLGFAGNRILVWYDGNQVMDVIDNNFDGRSAYLTGGVSVDLWTQSSLYVMSADDIVVQLQGSYVSNGTLLSSAFDGGVGVQLQTIAWDEEAGGSTSVRVRTRTADSADLLGSAPWSAVYTTSGSAITSANNRWIQYELELTSSDSATTPNFYEIRLTYSSPATA